MKFSREEQTVCRSWRASRPKVTCFILGYIMSNCIKRCKAFPKRTNLLSNRTKQVLLAVAPSLSSFVKFLTKVRATVVLGPQTPWFKTGAPESESSRNRSEKGGENICQSWILSDFMRCWAVGTQITYLPSYPAMPGWGAAARQHLVSSHLFHFIFRLSLRN